MQDRSRGRVRLLRVSRAGDVTEVLGGDVEVAGHAAAAGPDRRRCRHAGLIRRTRRGRGRHARTLTAFGASAAAAGIAAPTEVTIDGRDGYPVHGWVAKPAGEGPFPVILQIHGGPYASYGIHLFDETQVLVDAGYAVVYCNPRGSAGYGRAHGRSIRQAMGTVDFTDVIDFLDGAVAGDPSLDGARVGIMGGSYGGYLTAWVIAHDHRFAGAIVERGFLDPTSFQGTSDIGASSATSTSASTRRHRAAEPDGRRRPGDDADARHPLRAGLPLPARAGDAVLQRAQAPGDGCRDADLPRREPRAHAVGQPRHRVERFAAVLDWWQRKLPVG